MTTRKYLDPYAQLTAKTLGINAADIDWTDPKWMRAINTVDDKGQRGIMTLADWQRTLMVDEQYGYDKTVQGKEQKANLGRELLATFGFSSR